MKPEPEGYWLSEMEMRSAYASMYATRDCCLNSALEFATNYMRTGLLAQIVFLLGGSDEA